MFGLDKIGKLNFKNTDTVKPPKRPKGWGESENKITASVTFIKVNGNWQPSDENEKEATEDFNEWH